MNLEYHVLWFDCNKNRKALYNYHIDYPRQFLHYYKKRNFHDNISKAIWIYRSLFYLNILVFQKLPFPNIILFLHLYMFYCRQRSGNNHFHNHIFYNLWSFLAIIGKDRDNHNMICYILNNYEEYQILRFLPHHKIFYSKKLFYNLNIHFIPRYQISYKNSIGLNILEC